MVLWRRPTLLHQMGRWLVQRTADFAHDRVARKPELAQNFTHRTHHLRKIVGWNHDQRDQENQEYFEYTQVQIAQMPIRLSPARMLRTQRRALPLLQPTPQRARDRRVYFLANPRLSSV